MNEGETKQPMAFLVDYFRAREIWGERENWLWKQGKEPLAIRAFNGLCYSAIEQLKSGEWTDNEHTALESAKLEYDIRHRASFTLNNKVSDGGPAASDCNRDAIPPFAAPSC